MSKSKRNHKRIEQTIPYHRRPLEIGPITFDAGTLSGLGKEKLGKITPDHEKEFLRKHFGFVAGNVEETARAKLKKAEGKGKQDKVAKWSEVVGFYDKVRKDITFLKDSKRAGHEIADEPEELTP